MPSIQTAAEAAQVAGTSQTLWHLARAESPPVTAVLTRAAGGEYLLEVTFGTVARQSMPCSSAVAAVERADRLFTRLEEAGYRRQRPDKRVG